MELVFLFIVFMGIALVRMAREAAKVEKNRPQAGGTPDESDMGGKSLFDVLEELSREREPAPELDDHEFDPPDSVHPKMRRWVYPKRQDVRTQLPPSTSPPSPQVPVSPVVSVSNAPQLSRGKVHKVEGKAGLSHPVFNMDGLTPGEIAQRAVVLREVLGPPVGLR